MKADLELVNEVKDGNSSAFTDLVLRHQKQMMRVALRLTRDWDLAEDVVQESFIKAYQGLSKFEGRASFRSWLYQITLNTAKNRLRGVHRESLSVDALTVATGATAEKDITNAALKTLIQAEVDRLPVRQRMALQLRIFEDLSFKEIAEIMECPYDTAKANYRHGLMKLKDRLEKDSLHDYQLNSDQGIWIEYAGQALEVES